jgi:DNA polymerase III alpha subunit
MRIDKYGRQIFTENDLCNLFLKNPDQILEKAFVEKTINIHPELELPIKLNLTEYKPLSCTVEEYDAMNQEHWFMPSKYQNFDIAKYVLDLCQTDAELQRVGQELLLFQEREMFTLLRFCKYLVDLMRERKVVWGVGRGSSVASYVLYLIGIHKIDSLYYDLPIEEFLK